MLSGKGVLARTFHALFKSSVEGPDRGRLTRSEASDEAHSA